MSTYKTRQTDKTVETLLKKIRQKAFLGTIKNSIQFIFSEKNKQLWRYKKKIELLGYKIEINQNKMRVFW